MELMFVRVDDVLAGETPFLLDSFDRLPEAERLRKDVPQIGALRVVCSELGLPRDFEKMGEICTEAARSLVFDRRSLPGYRPWLFVATPTSLPDNRITRYKKLWKGIEERCGVGAGRHGPEVLFQSAEGLRFAAAAELTRKSFAEGTRLLRGLTSSALVWTAREGMDSEAETRRFFERAFPLRKGVPDGRTDWIRLASAYCPLGDVLVRASGSWDERECALDLIGVPEQVSRLESDLPEVLERST